VERNDLHRPKDIPGQPLTFGDSLLPNSSNSSLNDFVRSSFRAFVAFFLLPIAAVVQRLCELVFAEFRLVKITSHVFAENAASARVLFRHSTTYRKIVRALFSLSRHPATFNSPFWTCTFS
jgi:hypothetical protein